MGFSLFGIFCKAAELLVLDLGRPSLLGELSRDDEDECESSPELTRTRPYFTGICNASC